MEMRDDEQFEGYLKQFRPVAPKGDLPKPPAIERDGIIWLMAASAVLIVVGCVFAIRTGSGRQPVIATQVEHRQVSVPLTISKADLHLARSKSIKAALDEIAFLRPATAVPTGSQSALEVLGKEKTGL